MKHHSKSMPPQSPQDSKNLVSSDDNDSFKSVNYFYLKKHFYRPALNSDDFMVEKLQAEGISDTYIKSLFQSSVDIAIFADKDPCEELSFPSSNLERYAYFMSEIERRLEVIKDIHNNIPLKKNYVKINAEIIASQIRRILELFATSFLMITNHKKTKSHKAIGALFSSESLIFPDELLKKKIKDIYDKCNRISHSENPFTLERKQRGIRFSLDFNNVFEEIHNLLMSHAICCSNGDICLRYCDNTGRKFVVLVEIDSNGSFIVNQVIESKSMEDRDEYFKGSHSDIDYWLQELENNLHNKISKPIKIIQKLWYIFEKYL